MENSDLQNHHDPPIDIWGEITRIPFCELCGGALLDLPELAPCHCFDRDREREEKHAEPAVID